MSFEKTENKLAGLDAFMRREAKEVEMRLKKVEYVRDYMLDEPERRDKPVMLCEECGEDIYIGDRCLVSATTVLCNECLDQFTKKEGWGDV